MFSGGRPIRACSPTSTIGRSIIFGCVVIRFTSSLSLAFSRLIFAALKSGSLVRIRFLALNQIKSVDEFSVFSYDGFNWDGKVFIKEE